MNHKVPDGARSPGHITTHPVSGGAAPEAWTLQAVARAKQGDAHAVRQLYSRFAPAVRQYVASLVRDADLADDVVQTTFLKVLTRIGRYEARDVPFEGWLLRVARNAAYDELRRRRVREAAPLADHDGSGLAPAAVRDRSDVPDALEKLPAAWREVLVLRHVVGLSVTEVAERLGTDRRSVLALQDRACASLRAALRGGVPAPGPVASARFVRHRERSLDRPLIEQLG